MNIYVWRHNKTFHSHSMIDEPCVNNGFYLDAIAIVLAENMDAALAQLAKQNAGWRIADLRMLPCTIYPADKAVVLFSELRGSIPHL